MSKTVGLDVVTLGVLADTDMLVTVRGDNIFVVRSQNLHEWKKKQNAISKSMLKS